MSTPEPTAEPKHAFCAIEWTKKKLEPYLVPYYITVFAVLGALTTGFLVVIGLLILVAANFNVLGLIE